jgi:hypothetical protein
MADKGRDDAALNEPVGVDERSSPGDNATRQGIHPDSPASTGSLSAEFTVIREALFHYDDEFSREACAAAEAALARLEARQEAMEKALWEIAGSLGREVELTPVEIHRIALAALPTEDGA